MNTLQPLHPEDGDLVRFLDHELHHGECRQLMSHLSHCEVCAERMRSFTDLTRGLGEMLPYADPSAAEVELMRLRVAAALGQANAAPARGRWAPPPGVLRIAAAAVLLFGVTLGVQPVRAWVMERLGLGAGAQVVVLPQGSAESMAVTQPQTTVTFSPVDDVFTFTIDRSQDAGELSLSIADVPSASLQIVGMVRDVVMLPGGVHIANDPGTSANYSVALPSRLRRVVVVLGDETLASFEVADGELPWTQRLSLRR